MSAATSLASTLPGHRRLFFALWPDAALRERLLETFGAAAAAAGGRAVAAENLHVTLEFLGVVAASRLEELEALGAATSLPAAALSLDTLEWWPRPALGVAGTSRPAGALLDLQAELRLRLGERGFRVDARAFRPHLTLAREVRVAPPLIRVARIDWPLAELALVESHADAGGSRYTALARWSRGC